jgi:hypothetical protein
LRDAELRLRIQQQIMKGLLPCCVPNRILAGYGAGDVCVACELRITDAHIEYEIQDHRNGSSLSIHFGCYVVWQLECSLARLRGK